MVDKMGDARRRKWGGTVYTWPNVRVDLGLSFRQTNAKLVQPLFLSDWFAILIT
jgi:hypothetical protein